MLSWWLRKPAIDGCAGDGDLEAETPAPVFAARALKSAIFGTPGFPDETVYDMDSPSKSAVTTKPQGILVTPGTANSRRKTVSFGNEIIDHEDRFDDEKVSLDWAAEIGKPTKRNRKTSLTQTLENARSAKLKASKAETKLDMRMEAESKTQPQRTNQPMEALQECKMRRLSRSTEEPNASKDIAKLRHNLGEADMPDQDSTVDLSKPKSSSGKFWKSEYEEYHEQALKEMQRLITYKSLAKSFAKMKDTEAAELAAQLTQEQQRASTMESIVSELSKTIAASRPGKSEDTSEMVKELARQTTLAIQYRAQVEEFRILVEDDHNNLKTFETGNKSSGSSSIDEPERALFQTARELKKAREQLKELVSMKEEMMQLKGTLATVERNTIKLREENHKLTQQLLHSDSKVEMPLGRGETQRKLNGEHYRRDDNAFKRLQNEYDNLKELAKSQRRDAEYLLKKRHDQVLELKKEIASLKFSACSVEELHDFLRKKTIEHDEIVATYQKTEEMSTPEHTDHMSPLEQQEDRSKQFATMQKSDFSGAGSPMRESQIPMSTQTSSRTVKAMASAKPICSEKLYDGSKNGCRTALSEVVNGASADAKTLQKTKLMQHTPHFNGASLTDQMGQISIASSVDGVPSAETSVALPMSRALRVEYCYPNPRPTYNLTSSPPKPILVHPQSAVNEKSPISKPPQDLTARRLANIPSHRMSNMDRSRMRSIISPQRVAAAKARLHQKQLQKKGSLSRIAEKENVKN